MKCSSQFGPVRKNRDAVGQASRRSSLLQLPDAKFCGKNLEWASKTKNSLNSVSTCLRAVDTRRCARSIERYHRSPWCSHEAADCSVIDVPPCHSSYGIVARYPHVENRGRWIEGRYFPASCASESVHIVAIISIRSGQRTARID